MAAASTIPSAETTATSCFASDDESLLEELVRGPHAAGVELDSAEFAAAADARDELAALRDEFLFPPTEAGARLRTAGARSVYLCGNSLGLQPKRVKTYVVEELEKWSHFGVEGHFRTALPWVTVDETCVEATARLVGAKPLEVAVMNSLTTNLHLMMVPFYRPTPERFKIVIEAKAFPSDYHAVKSQIQFHGFRPEDALIEVKPREGEELLRVEDIEAVIAEQGPSIALVLFSGVQYYTGQLFDLERIVRAGHAQGCRVGFDLAHAVGNLPLRLHDWDVDFACWCSYKYLNSGPGSIGGCFVHERFAEDTTLPRFAGWWGHRKGDRFKMSPDFVPSPGAFGFQLSNPPVLPLAALRASLELFDEATMPRLRRKSLALTGYLELLIQQKLPDVKILTPRDRRQRGCQLSLVFPVPIRRVYEKLQAESVIVDIREPNAMRVAPAPLYNNFSDVWEFVHVLAQVIAETAGEA